MKTLGVIGGLGPMATAYFLQLLTQMSNAKTDQEHMEILMFSKPSIPDRTKYILGMNNENPINEMVTVGKKLKENGADIIAIPCITAHYFHDELENKIGLPIIHAVQETSKYLKNMGIKRVGILATDGTIQSQLFQQDMIKYGIQCIVPEKKMQKKVMKIIYDEVKAGKAIDASEFHFITNNLFENGAEVILLACTELSLVKKDCKLHSGYLDVMEVLARKAVESCNCLREEYKELDI